MSDLLQLAITGLFTGLGSTIGAWLANKHVNQNLERLSQQINKLMKKRTGAKR